MRLLLALLIAGLLAGAAAWAVDGQVDQEDSADPNVVYVRSVVIKTDPSPALGVARKRKYAHMTGRDLELYSWAEVDNDAIFVGQYFQLTSATTTTTTSSSTSSSTSTSTSTTSTSSSTTTL